MLISDNTLLNKRYSLDAFHALYEVLTICAGLSPSAKILINMARFNAIAGIDESGFGGHTPIFHTVNQHNNKCIDVMNFLISNKADLTVTVKGLIWGKGYEWETFIPSVNPISYAMM
jgi:hypothetical protein